MGKRTHSIVFIVTAVLASAFATLVAVGVTAGTADACTPVGPPRLTVRPASDLRPGQSIVVSGRHFVTIVHTPFPGFADPNHPIPPCSVEFRPMIGIAVTWSGPGLTQVLATVDGYDFDVEVRVPDGATKGQAVIAAGGITAVVQVGATDEPCPMPAGTTLSPGCPDPCAYPPAGDSGPSLAIGCPCPAASSGATSPNAVVPPWCPNPCPLPARNAVAPGFPCPDPCVYPAGAERAAVWCPDPCPFVAPDAQRCAPCPANLAGGAATSAQPARPCPDPCAYPNGSERPSSDRAPAIAVWCPPVEAASTPAASTPAGTAVPGTAVPETSTERITDARPATTAVAAAGADRAPAMETVRVVHSALQPLMRLIALVLNALGR